MHVNPNTSHRERRDDFRNCLGDAADDDAATAAAAEPPWLSSMTDRGCASSSSLLLPPPPSRFNEDASLFPLSMLWIQYYHAVLL